MVKFIHNGSEHILEIEFNNSHAYQHYKKIIKEILEKNGVLEN